MGIGLKPHRCPTLIVNIALFSVFGIFIKKNLSYLVNLSKNFTFSYFFKDHSASFKWHSFVASNKDFKDAVDFYMFVVFFSDF